MNEAPPEGLADVPVFLGGPVGRNQLMFAAFEWAAGEGLKLNHNVGVEEAHQLVGEDPTSIRAFVGYAGWSAGQLEAEMKSAAAELRFEEAALLRDEIAELRAKLWFEIMRGLGPWYKMLAAAPDDPSLN